VAGDDAWLNWYREGCAQYPPREFARHVRGAIEWSAQKWAAVAAKMRHPPTPQLSFGAWRRDPR
jgi:hypothetical protein